MSIGFTDFLEHTGLGKARKKNIRDFSSGMKQKLKLGLALFSHVDFFFLDEPTSNLDSSNTDWFLELLKEKKEKKMILMASNIAEEYQICQQFIELEKLKA